MRSHPWLGKTTLWMLLYMGIIVGCTAVSDTTPVPTVVSQIEQLEDAPVVASSPEPAKGSQLEADAATLLTGRDPMLTYETLSLPGGETIEYALLLPANYNPQQDYPVLLALPPGGQNRQMVDAGLNRYWAEEAGRRGWIVVSPAAPGGQLFFQGAEKLIPEFLDDIAAQYHPQGGKFHAAGISNGGISAFRVALNEPQRVHSLLVLPSFPRGEADFQRLDELIDIPVAMFVGEHDTTWIPSMEAAAKALTDLGGMASLEIVPGEGHVIQSLTGAQLFDLLESYQ
jgi:pimeloyl-ACP methyl ester carboxylesterase